MRRAVVEHMRREERFFSVMFDDGAAPGEGQMEFSRDGDGDDTTFTDMGGFVVFVAVAEGEGAAP